MKKFVMTDEKRHDLRELKITVIVLLSVAFVLGMFNWACYLIDSVYAKQLPLGTYLAHYPSRNLAAYKETIKEFSVPTLKDIKSVYGEKEITGRYNNFLDSCLRVYKFEYGTELDAECEAFFTKYVSDTGVNGFFGLIGRPSVYLTDTGNDYYGVSVELESTIKAQVIIPDVDASVLDVKEAVGYEMKVAFGDISESVRKVIGVGLPQVAGKEDTYYVCIVLKDGVLELAFNENHFLSATRTMSTWGGFASSFVSKNIGMLVDLRNEAFAEE